MSCQSIRSAITSGATSDPEVQAHLEGCEACRHHQQVTVFLSTLATPETAGPPPTSADELWHRAQVIQRLVERQGLERRALRPVLWSHGLILAGILVALSFLGWSAVTNLAPQQVGPDAGWLLMLLLVGALPLVLGLPITAWLMLEDA